MGESIRYSRKLSPADGTFSVQCRKGKFRGVLRIRGKDGKFAVWIIEGPTQKLLVDIMLDLVDTYKMRKL